MAEHTDIHNESDSDAVGVSPNVDASGSDMPEAPTASAKPATGPLDDTLEIPENQEKPLAPPAAELTLNERIERRLRDTAELLSEKELLQLVYVMKKASKAYYLCWKEDSNRLFSLQVDLKRRQKQYATKG
ncbi:MAG: hypothetical protein NTY08_03370 [Proteobacteria bacterium]|jgi:hypothetical protein|nr:hypothetical protein [Pseudomonadota bacterium]